MGMYVFGCVYSHKTYAPQKKEWDSEKHQGQKELQYNTAYENCAKA